MSKTGSHLLRLNFIFFTFLLYKSRLFGKYPFDEYTDVGNWSLDEAEVIYHDYSVQTKWQGVKRERKSFCNGNKYGNINKWTLVCVNRGINRKNY